MTYELAKELKDAGFPQEAIDFLTKPSPKGVGSILVVGKETVYAPTLSELICECGIEMVELNQITPTIWYAASRGQTIVAKGPTPEEAVARLWLALQKPAVE